MRQISGIGHNKNPPPPLKGSRDLTVILLGLERNLLLALLLVRLQAVFFSCNSEYQSESYAYT